MYKKALIIINYKRDIRDFFLLFFLAIISIYLLPRYFALAFQLLLLFMFYRSDKDYFWLALVFIIETFPGGLFSRYTNDINHTFSFLPGSPVGTLYFWMVFTIIAFFKSIRQKKTYNVFLGTNFLVLFIYFVFLILVFGIYKYSAVIRMLLPWTFFFIFPRLLKNEKDFSGFFNLIFSFSIFVFLSQIVNILTGKNLASFLSGSSFYFQMEELKGVARPTDGIFIPFLSIVGSLYYLTRKRHFFNKNYIYSILAISIISIFISATRVWFFSALFLFFGYLIIFTPEKVLKSLKFSIPVLFIFLIFNNVPILNQQVSLATERFETIYYLLQGDITAGGTLQRLDLRGPKVMRKFYENPIIGWGYGNEAVEYSDGHVGNQNLLMHTGIIGFSLFLWLWLSYIGKLIMTDRNLSKNNPYKKTPKLFVLFLLSMLMIHSSAQWFNYLLQFMPGFTIALIFTFASYVSRSSSQYEKLIRKKIRNQKLQEL